jgi:hypothetical protein
LGSQTATAVVAATAAGRERRYDAIAGFKIGDTVANLLHDPEEFVT